MNSTHIRAGRNGIIGVLNGLGDDIRAGLCNQRQELFGLILIAKERNLCISLNTLNWRVSWENKKRVNHKELWDVKQWNKNLPRIVNYRATKWVSSNKLWNTYEKYIKKIRNNNTLKRSDLEKDSFECLKPISSIQQIIDENKISSEYIALHARIEKDLILSPKMNNSKVKLQWLYSEIKIKLPKMDVLFLATSINDVHNLDDLTLINSRITPWGDENGLIIGGSRITSKTQYPIVHSIIDFELCVNASIFIGTSLSTFSNSIVFARYLRNTECANNWTYTPTSLSQRLDDGRVVWEWM